MYKFWTFKEEFCLLTYCEPPLKIQGLKITNKGPLKIIFKLNVYNKAKFLAFKNIFKAGIIVQEGILKENIVLLSILNLR